MFQMNLLKKFKTSFEMRLSHDNQLLCHNTSNRSFVYEVKSLEEISVLTKPSQPSQMKFSRNNEYLLIKNTKGGVWIYDTEKFQIVRNIKTTKSFRLLDHGFSITQDSGNILDILQTSQGDQIVSISIDSLEHSIMTEFEHALIHFNHYSEKNSFHLFTLSCVNPKSGYRENSVLKVNEPINKHSIELLSNSKVLNWDSVIFNSVEDVYIVINDYEIVLIDSEFKNVLNKVLIVDEDCQENTGYFKYLDLSNDGNFIVITYSNRIFIFRYNDLKKLLVENIPYASFAGFSKDDRYLLIGTWEGGYLLENNLKYSFL